MLAPVVIFVYNRPDHTKRTIDALSKNILAKETSLYIYSDASKNDSNNVKVQETRAYIETIPELGLFKDVTIYKSEHNKGLACSVINGVSEVISKYEKVIVLEDDLVSSIDFLSFMNDALDFYNGNNKIWSICGYSFSMNIPNDYVEDVYLSYRAGSWGWGTWKDRWDTVDWDVRDYPQFKQDRNLREKFNRGGRDMANMLDVQMLGKIDSWAIRWCYTQSKMDKLTVYPISTKIKNIGIDGTGTHSGVNPKYDVSFNEKKYFKYKFSNPELDQRILDSFRDKFMTKSEYALFKIKSLIKKVLNYS